MKRSITLILCVLSLQVLASNPKSRDWTITPSYSKAFIENKSQFNGRNKLENSTILYAIDHGPYQVYFTKTGLTYRLDKKLPRKKWDKTKPLTGEDEWMKIMAMRRQVNMQSDIIHMNWLNANKDVELIASDETSEYFSYSMGSNSMNPNHVRGFKKLTYKNIYPGIDAIYEFHPEQGFKYSFIVHPGADPSLIQMKYSEDAKLVKDDDGNLLISTQFGNITDHAPTSYYEKNKSGKINSSFEIQNNIITFNLGTFNKNKIVIIDPWTVFPPSPNSNKVWEVETDNAGNVYAYMGDMPITLRKYNSAGAIQWTYLTAWDSTGFWIGGMITHPSGDSYITSGSNGEIRKITPAGSQVWYNNPNALTSYEYWSLGFNCDLTRLVIGGTRLTFSIPFPILRGIVTEVNLNSGAQISTTVVGYGNVIGIPPDVQEVSSLSSAPNGNYYFLTLDSVGSISNDLSTINLKAATTYNFDYYIPGYGFGTKQPISAIRATNSCFYTHNGALIDKRDLTSGAIINSASIPGGISNTTFFGTNVQGNGGLDIDSCGNVYVGSGNGVHKYDANLNLILSATTPGAVYDVDVSNNGEVAFSGSNFVGTVFLSSCNVPIQICSTTLIAAASATDIVCNGDCNGTASANAIGGTSPFTYSWSTGATTQVINNLCPGIYTVIITDSLFLSDTATVTISEPSPILTSTSSTNSTCGANNGSATVGVSGGTAPFTFIWSPIGGTDSIATGLVAGTYVVIISDANGCSTTDTVNVSSTNGPQVSIALQIDPLCFGAANGTATISATAGTPPYSYSWTTSPVQTTPTAIGLSVGTYTVTVTDTLGCITTQLVTIGEPDSISISISLITSDECGLGNGSASATSGGGSPGYSYSWNTTPVQTGQQAINLNFGTYIVTVTDTIGCTGTQNVVIPEIPSPVATLTGQTNVSCPGDSTGSATFSVTSGTLPYTYAWSTNPVQTTPTASGLPAGSYTITVTDQTGCTTSQIVNITAASSLAVTSSSTPTSCGLSNGTATVNVTGGTPGYNYNWNTTPVQTGQTATGLIAGIYNVTVTDASGCNTIQQVTVTAIPDLTPTAISNPACGSGNGSATVSVTGGTTPYTYQWNPAGGTTSTATSLNDGVYSCLITDANGCTSTISVTVVVYPDVVADAGQDLTIEPGNSTQLSATGGTGYSWSPTAGLSCTNCQSPVANPEVTTTYCVIVTDDNGCSATACVKVSVVEICGEIFVPDAFSPDGSNNPENEKQCVYGRCIASMEFSIFTRWGERVFSTTDQKNCWDGKYKGQQMNTGVYVYYLKATLTDGTQINKQGDISLIR